MHKSTIHSVRLLDNTIQLINNNKILAHCAMACKCDLNYVYDLINYNCYTTYQLFMYV